MPNLTERFNGAAQDLNDDIADSGEVWTARTGLIGKTGAGSVYAPAVWGTATVYTSSWIPPSPDYEVSIVMDDRPTDGTNGGPGVVLRWQDGNNYYIVNYAKYVGLIGITKNASGFVGLATVAATLTTGDILTGTVSGTNPTTLTVKKNGVQILSVQDAAAPFTAAGKAGIWFEGGNTSTTGLHVSRLEAGSDTIVTSYTRTGPGAGVVGAASQAFTVSLVGTGILTGSVTITPTCSVGIVSGPVPLTDDTRSGTFTVTATAAETGTVSTTNNRGLLPALVITSFVGYVGVSMKVAAEFAGGAIGVVGWTVRDAAGNPFLLRATTGITIALPVYTADILLPGDFSGSIDLDDTVRTRTASVDFS